MTNLCTSYGPYVACHLWDTLEYATIFHMVPMCFASQSTHMGSTWNPCVFAIVLLTLGQCVITIMGPQVGCPIWNTGVCNNFPRGIHMFCISNSRGWGWGLGEGGVGVGCGCGGGWGGWGGGLGLGVGGVGVGVRVGVGALLISESESIRYMPPFRPHFHLRYTLWFGIQISNILLLGIIFSSWATCFG